MNETHWRERGRRIKRRERTRDKEEGKGRHDDEQWVGRRGQIGEGEGEREREEPREALRDQC